MYSELIIIFIKDYFTQNGTAPNLTDIASFLSLSEDRTGKILRKMKSKGLLSWKTHHDNSYCLISSPSDGTCTDSHIAASSFSSFYTKIPCPNESAAYRITAYLSSKKDTHKNGFSNKEIADALGMSINSVRYSTAWLAANHYISHAPHAIRDILLIRPYIPSHDISLTLNRAPRQYSPDKYSERYQRICCPNSSYAEFFMDLLEKSNGYIEAPSIMQFSFQFGMDYCVFQKTICWLSANGYIAHKPRSKSYYFVKHYYHKGRTLFPSSQKLHLPRLAAKISAYIYEFNIINNCSPTLSDIREAFIDRAPYISRVICWLARAGYINHTPYKRDDIVFISLYEYPPKMLNIYSDLYEKEKKTYEQIKEVSAMHYPQYIRTLTPNYY